MLLLILVLACICLLGLRLSQGPMEIPYLASKLATAASGEGITVQMQEADLAWAGYHQGGGVPLFLQLGNIMVRNAEGVELVTIPRAKLIFTPSALLGSKAPILVSGSDARFPGSAVPVSLRAAIRLGAWFTLSRADLDVRLGAGRLGAGATSLPITGGSFSLSLTPHRILLANGHLALAPAGDSHPQVGFAGRGALAALWQGSVTVTADSVGAKDLPDYWPPTVVPQTRDWVTKNISVGTAAAASVTLQLAAPANLARIDLTGVSGGFDGKDLTLRWIPGAQPITALNGHMQFLDRDNALVTASSARLGGMALSGGQMKISGMSQKHQFGALSLTIDGKVQDVIAVLNAPPLNFLKQAPPVVARATGDASARLTTNIPFLKDIKFSDVTLQIDAALSNVAMASPVAGLDFDSGAGKLTATTAGLAVQATANFAGEPASLALTASFQGAGGLRGVTLNSLAGPVMLHRFGLDVQSALADPVTGAMPYTLKLSGDPAGSQTATINADLTPAALSIPSFAWKKAAAVPGQLSLSATLKNGALTSLDDVSVTAPKLDISASADQRQVIFKKFAIGRTSAQGVVDEPTAADPAWSAKFSGPLLDVRAISSAPTKAKNAAPPPPKDVAPSGPLWRVALTFAQLDLAASPAPALADLRFSGSGQGGTLEHATATAGDITVTVAPKTKYQQRVLLHAPDGGFLLRALDAYQQLDGGVLDLDARFGGAGPTEGTLSLNQFRLMQAPAFTKILQAITIYGASDAASGPGLAFTKAVVPFRIGNDTLTLLGARAFSSSLGFTANGQIALATGVANIDGTIIPAYALNALPGKIPVIGKLFTAEKGGGLFAIRAKISGPLTDPQVSVNPLSVLTPGVLRDVFGVSAK